MRMTVQGSVEVFCVLVCDRANNKDSRDVGPKICEKISLIGDGQAIYQYLQLGFA